MDWLELNHHLEKTFHFKKYRDVMKFVNAVAEIATEQKHHPQMIVDFNQVVIRITTHDAGNSITEKDHLLSKAIDKIVLECN